MLSIKRKSNLTLVVYLAVHVLAATLVFGCDKRKSFYDNNRSDINLVPIQMENPEEPVLDDEDIDLVVTIEDEQSDSKQPTRRNSRVGEVPPPPTHPVNNVSDDDDLQADEEQTAPKRKPVLPPPPAVSTKPQPKAPSAPAASGSEASKFIKVAFWVVQNEARKIGTPCNFYVSRVLELAGYSDDGFLANDFDIYAKNHFSSYKNEVFNTTNIESERARLKRHIWSYPARTPFIIQWERAKPKPGHIAIVERIGDQLVVYQASLNRHIARREQTSIDRLLSHARSARMTVYSEFVAK